MMVRHPATWQRLLLEGTTALVAVATLGCRPDMAAWRSRLAAPEVQRMIGLWNVGVRRDPIGGDTASSPWVAGQLALTLNEERRNGPGFGEPPMFFGSYNVDFRRVGLGAGTQAGIPAVVGRLRGDTLELLLALQSKLPVELTGMIAEDSILGRWTVHQRAGADATGDFVLRRR